MNIDKRRLELLAWTYLVVGALLAAAHLVLDGAIEDVASTVAILALLPAGWIARRVHHFPVRLMALVAGIGVLYALEAVVLASFDGATAEAVSTALDLTANAIIIGVVAFAVSQRRGRFSPGDALDGIIIGLGAWIAAWVLLVQPVVDSGEGSTVSLVLNAFYVPMTVPLLVLAVMYLFSGLTRRPAAWLMVAALILNVVGDAIYALEDTRGLGVWAIEFADVLYILTYACAGAALVHPSAPELIGNVGRRRQMNLSGRVAMTAAALTVPIALVTILPVGSTLDRVVRVTSTLTLMILVGARLRSAVRTHFASQQRIIELAHTDELTGLPNMTAVLDDAAQLIDDIWRSEARPTFVLFDLDRFKNINDSLGHAAGDEVIEVVAERLHLAAHSIGATVGRTAGDEFLVLDPTPTSTGQALAHAEVLHAVFKQPLSIKAGVVFVTASAGVSVMPAGRPVTSAELFRHADIAMYRAKDAGRNCLALYDESMQERVAYRLDVETALHGALDRREFRLFHQPIVDVDSGRVAGFEALIRWQRGDGTIMSPAEFIPIAEETGIITSIGGWALLEALTQLRTWTDDRVVPENTTVSVNVSPRQLADPHFLDLVQEAISRSGVAPHLLWLEVTESVMIANPETARTTLQQLRALGIRIALDDFGTGYSSLSLLQQFPIQRIKIDRSFVNGIAGSSNDRSLVRSIVALGGSMGLDIVAEGVETVEQLKLLRQLGCAKAQGFLISHPVPAEAMRSTVAALESLAAWPEFSQLLGSSGAPSGTTARHPIAGN